MATSLSGFTVLSNGTTITATLSTNGCYVTGTPPDAGLVTFTGTSVTVSSWSITGTVLTMNLSGTIYGSNVVRISVGNTGSNVILDATDNFINAVANAAVTNNSSQISPSGITSPLDISGCQLWLDSSRGTYGDIGLTSPVSTNGATIKGWADQSGNNNNFTNNAGTTNPTVETNAVYTKRGVTFGSTNLLSLVFASSSATLQSLSSTGDYTFVIVIRPDAINSQYSQVFSLGNPGADKRFFYLFKDTDGFVRYNGVKSGFNSLTASQTELFISEYTQSSGVENLYRNGTSVFATSTNNASGSSGNWQIGAGTSGFPTTASYFHIIVYNKVLTSQEKTSLSNWLMSDTGINKDILIYTDGDSLAARNQDAPGGDFGALIWPKDLVTSLSNRGIKTRSYFYAFTGKTLDDMLTAEATNLAPVTPQNGFTNRVVFFNETINQIRTVGSTPAVTYGKQKTYGDALSVLGNKRIFATCTPNSLISDSDRLTTNALDVADFPNATSATYIYKKGTGVTWADYLIYSDSNPVMGNGQNSNTAYFPDNTHYSTIAHAYYSDTFALPALFQAIGYGVTVSGPSTGATGQASSTFTASLPYGTFLSTDSGITVSCSNATINVIAAGGTITGNNSSSVLVKPAAGATSFTFTVTPANSATNSITFSNTQGWVNPTVSYVSTGSSSAQYSYIGSSPVPVVNGKLSVVSTTGLSRAVGNYLYLAGLPISLFTTSNGGLAIGCVINSYPTASIQTGIGGTFLNLGVNGSWYCLAIDQNSLTSLTRINNMYGVDISTDSAGRPAVNIVSINIVKRVPVVYGNVYITAVTDGTYYYLELSNT
jgi:hypothetical protein